VQISYSRRAQAKTARDHHHRLSYPSRHSMLGRNPCWCAVLWIIFSLLAIPLEYCMTNFTISTHHFSVGLFFLRFTTIHHFSVRREIKTISMYVCFGFILYVVLADKVIYSRRFPKGDKYKNKEQECDKPVE